MLKTPKTAIARVSVNPLVPRPYRPPTQTTGIWASRSDVATSRKNGSPNEPASFVWSRRAIFLTVFGSAARECLVLHGGAGGRR